MSPELFKKVVPMVLGYLGSGGSLITSSIAQLATFAILARSLGTTEFALYVTISAFTNVAVQVCGLGAQESLVRRIARDPADYPRFIGHALLLTFLTGGVLLVIGLLTLPLIVPVSANSLINLGAIGLLLVSTVLILRFVSLATASYVGRSNFAVANSVDVGFALTRTGAAALACLVFKVDTVAGWAPWLFAAHLAVAAVAACLIRRMGSPSYTLIRDEIRIGALFSTQFIFKAIRQNTDILALSLFTSPEVVGSYGVARRVLDSSYLSIEALNRIVYPGSAVAMMHGFHNAYNRVRKVALTGAGIAILAALAVNTLGPLMPSVFGDKYPSMVGFTRSLCWLLIPMAVTSISLEAFGAAGRQDVRALVFNSSSIAAAILVALAAYLVGVSGAFISSYVVEAATACAALAVWLRYVDSDRKRPSMVASAE